MLILIVLSKSWDRTYGKCSHGNNPFTCFARTILHSNSLIIVHLKADIDYWKDSISNDIEVVRSIIRSIPTDSLDQKASLDNAERRLRSIKGNTRSFKAEIRLLADPSERNSYKAELKRYEQTVAELTAEIKNMRSEGNREALFIGANGDGGPDGIEDNPVAAGDALLNDASRLQDKTQESLLNTQKMIAESKEVGMGTVEELQRQREQLNNIDKDVMRMENSLDRADKLIKTFGKRMATDRLIQCFACTNVLLLVAVVIYVVVKGGLAKTREELAPESPVGGNDNSEVSRMLRGALGW